MKDCVFRSLVIAVVAFLATRAVLEAIAVESFRYDGQTVHWLALWIHWDAGYYLDIATRGYHLPDLVTGQETGQSGLNFLPLLPMGVALTRLLIPQPIVAGLVFSNLCLVAAAVVLHVFAERRFDRAVADFSVFSLMLLPGSFALSGVMTESPFLLLSIGAMATIRARPAVAAVCIGLLSITRPTGILLLGAAVLDWVIDRVRGRPAPLRSLFLFALAPLPLVVYAVVMLAMTGDALAVVHSHQAFWNIRSGLPFSCLFDLLLSADPRLQTESGVALCMLGALLVRARSFSAGEWLFVLSSIETSSSAESLVPSLIRYMVGLYPLHMAVGAIGARRVGGPLLLGLFAMVDGALVLAWVHGRDLFV